MLDVISHVRLPIYRAIGQRIDSQIFSRTIILDSSSNQLMMMRGRTTLMPTMCLYVEFHILNIPMNRVQ